MMRVSRPNRNRVRELNKGKLNIPRFNAFLNDLAGKREFVWLVKVTPTKDGGFAFFPTRPFDHTQIGYTKAIFEMERRHDPIQYIDELEDYEKYSLFDSKDEDKKLFEDTFNSLVELRTVRGGSFHEIPFPIPHRRTVLEILLAIKRITDTDAGYFFIGKEPESTNFREYIEPEKRFDMGTQ